MATLILTVRISPVLLLAIACFTRWRNSYLDLGQILAVGSPIRRSRLNLKWRPRVSVRGLMIAVLVLGSVLGLIFHRAGSSARQCERSRMLAERSAASGSELAAS